MIRKIIYISIFTFWLQTSLAIAGTTGSEELKDTSSQSATGECFERFSRAMFEFNYDLDRIIFQPVAKGYRALPVPIRKGTGNAINNLRSLLTLSNNILQGEFGRAGNNAARFGINSTAGILGIFDPASKLGFEFWTNHWCVGSRQWLLLCAADYRSYNSTRCYRFSR